MYYEVVVHLELCVFASWRRLALVKLSRSAIAASECLGIECNGCVGGVCGSVEGDHVLHLNGPARNRFSIGK